MISYLYNVIIFNKLKCKKDYGKGFEFFIQAAQICIAKLFTRQPSSENNNKLHSSVSSSSSLPSPAAVAATTHLSLAEYILALSSLTPPSLADNFSALTTIEIDIIATLTRLVGKKTVGGTNTLSNSNSSNNNNIGGPTGSYSSQIPFKSLISEFDKLTGFISRKQVSRGQFIVIIRGLVSMGLLEVSNPIMKHIIDSDYMNDESVKL
jgi:hypothetical protein